MTAAGLNKPALVVASLLVCGALACNAFPPATPTPVPPTPLPPTSEPTPTAVACDLTAGPGVTAYERPSLSADVFGSMPVGVAIQVLARTSDDWLGFDPGVAQAANVGVFRLRWVQAAEVTLSGDCEGVPGVAGPAVGWCYTMPMEAVPVYELPDTSSPVIVTLQVEDYAGVIGVMGADWAQVALNAGNTGLNDIGWTESSTLNLNGPCDSLPEVAP